MKQEKQNNILSLKATLTMGIMATMMLTTSVAMASTGPVGANPTPEINFTQPIAELSDEVKGSGNTTTGGRRFITTIY